MNGWLNAQFKGRALGEMNKVIDSKSDLRTADILGFQVSTVSREESIEAAWRIVKGGKTGGFVACANPHSLMVAMDDPEFSASLKSADILLPDGIGIILAGRLLRRPFEERVAGMEFFEALSTRCNSEGGVSYFFLGSTPSVLRSIRERLARDYPSIRTVGVFSPPYKESFSEADNAVMIEAINSASPDVLWVGMTAPKQEKWIACNKHCLTVPLIGAVGAVFDFYAGTKKRSPDWLCRVGLEWLPRFLREPRRLWRRVLISNPKFIIHIASAMIKKKIKK